MSSSSKASKSRLTVSLSDLAELPPGLSSSSLRVLEEKSEETLRNGQKYVNYVETKRRGVGDIYEIPRYLDTIDDARRFRNKPRFPPRSSFSVLPRGD